MSSLALDAFSGPEVAPAGEWTVVFGVPGRASRPSAERVRPGEATPVAGGTVRFRRAEESGLDFDSAGAGFAELPGTCADLPAAPDPSGEGADCPRDGVPLKGESSEDVVDRGPEVVLPRPFVDAPDGADVFAEPAECVPTDPADPDVSEYAMPGSATTAAPTPSATASTPTRPT